MSQGTLVTRQFGHRARLALSPTEVSKADARAHAARTLWNLLHAWWQMMPKDQRTLANADAAIRQARQALDFLAVLPAQAAQAVLKTYFQAWKNCWEGRARAPEFKARFRTRMSIDIPQGRDLHVVRVHRRWGMVNLPKIGRVKFRWTKDLPAGRHAGTENRITGARLIKDALGWHIAFRVTTGEATPEPHTGPEVGIDVGVTVPLALSDGTTYEHGQWLTEQEQAKLLRLEQRAAHRKQHREPGERTSRRLQHTFDQIAQLRAKAKRRAADWQHQTTTAIARTYGTVAVEALTITNMVTSARGTVEVPGKNVAQKAGLNRAIVAEAWGRTVTMLAYKTARHGGALVKVPAPGTSRRCSACGCTTPGGRESQAVFVCKNPDCGWSGNADHNAARNILHLYRIGLAAIPAAGRAVVRRARRVASSPPPQGRWESPSRACEGGRALQNQVMYTYEGAWEAHEGLRVIGSRFYEGKARSHRIVGESLGWEPFLGEEVLVGPDGQELDLFHSLFYRIALRPAVSVCRGAGAVPYLFCRTGVGFQWSADPPP